MRNFMRSFMKVSSLSLMISGCSSGLDGNYDAAKLVAEIKSDSEIDPQLECVLKGVQMLGRQYEVSKDAESWEVRFLVWGGPLIGSKPLSIIKRNENKISFYEDARNLGLDVDGFRKPVVKIIENCA